MSSMKYHTFTHYESLERVVKPNDLKETCRNLRQQIDATGIQFDAIAFTGMSGALVAPVLCYMMDKYPLIVRPDKSNKHSSHEVEGIRQF